MKSNDFRNVINFGKGPFSKCFPTTLKYKAGISNSSGLKRVFEKLGFLDGLLWMAGLTTETNNNRPVVREPSLATNHEHRHILLDYLIDWFVSIRFFSEALRFCFGGGGGFNSFLLVISLNNHHLLCYRQRISIIILCNTMHLSEHFIHSDSNQLHHRVDLYLHLHLRRQY